MGSNPVSLGVKSVTTGEYKNALTQLSAIDLFAKKHGITIIAVDSLTDAEGNAINGEYRTGNNIVISLDADGGLYMPVVGHEIFHYAESINAEDAKALAELIIDTLKASKGAEWLEARRREYAGYGYKDGGIDSEIAADFFGAAVTQKEFERQIKAAELNKSFTQKIIDKVKEVVAELKEIMQKLRGQRLIYDAALDTDAETLEFFVDNLERILNQAGTETKNTATENGVKYSIKRDANGNRYVDVEENILDGIPKNKWISTVKTTLSQKFTNGIPISGRLIKVNSISKNEFTASKYTKFLRATDGTIYADKFKSSNNLDEILLASTNYINEDLNHTRKDNIKEFARGEVLIRVGANDYSAKVIVGFTAGKQMLLYDIVDFAPTNIATKKRTHQDFGESRTPRKDVFSNITVTQKPPSVNSILSENPKKITTESKKIAGNSGVKRQASIANGTYDYTKSFEEQVDDWIKGKVPQRDSLLIGGTPKVMQEIGMNALPVTINQKHIDYAIKGTKDADHTIGAALLKQLPTALKNPVAIVSSNTMPNRVVALLNLRHNGKNVIAPVEIDGFGHTNNVRIDSNAVTSIFGKGNAVTTLLYNAVQKEANGRKDIFFWNKKEAVSLLQGAGLQLPRGLPKDGFIHSIRENGTNINTKFENVTQSLQFKRWFGDWQNHPETIAPELLNADGTPKVFYHSAKKNGGFTVFKDWQYFTDKKSYAERYAEKENDKALYEVFITANKIFDTRNADARKIHRQIRQEYGLSELTENGLPDWTDGYDITDYLNEHPELGYDAIILNDGGDLVNGEPVSRGTSIVIKDSTQIKSATDNIGTFDGTNPDIRFQRKLPDVQEKLKKMSGSDDIDDVKRMAYGLADDFMKYAKAARLEMTETRGLMPQPTRVSEIVAKYNDYRKTGVSNKQLESDITDIFTDYMNGVGSSGTLFNYITDTIMKRELNSYEVIGDETFKAVRAYTDGGRFKVSDATVGLLVDTFGSLGEINGILRENYGFTIAKETDTRAETRAVWAPVGAQLAEEAGHVFDGTDCSYTSRYTTENGYVTSRKVYQCESCEGCPYRNECHTSKYDRRIRVSHKLTEQNQKATELITTDEGILLRMNRSIQVEGAFGIIKQDFRFRRFLTKGKAKTETQFFLIAFAYNVEKLCSRINSNRFGRSLFEKIIA